MNRHYENYLLKKYEPLYHGYHMGFAHGDGWFDLINNLSAVLCINWTRAKNEYEYVLENGTNWYGKTLSEDDIALLKAKVQEAAEQVPKVMQVKEKFGGLRFYVVGATDEQYSYINLVEMMAGRVCEVCGKRGKTHRGGWIRTLCAKHQKERQEKS